MPLGRWTCAHRRSLARRQMLLSCGADSGTRSSSCALPVPAPQGALLVVLLLCRASCSATQKFYPPPERCPATENQTQSYCPRHFYASEAKEWVPIDISSPGSTVPATGPSFAKLPTLPRHELKEPQARPCISNPNTCRRKAGDTRIVCSDGGMQFLNDPSSGLEKGRWAQMIPGSPAVCGHGNREFSFFVRPADNAQNKVSLIKLMLVFAAGGICWDAESCGQTSSRTMGSGNNIYGGKSGDESAAIPRRLLDFVWVPKVVESKPGFLNEDDVNYKDYDTVIIPDCTGDMSIGNRSYTYTDGKGSCVTAHHMGGINTGMALDWVMDERNSKELTEILILNTGFNNLGQSQAFGGHGPVFWASYLKKRKPDMKVRVVTEQNLGIHGPAWFKTLEEDSWGSSQLHVPRSMDLLLPPPAEWSISKDDMTMYYEWAVRKMPSLAFADVASLHDPSQIRFFQLFGGRPKDCCVDGCSCTSHRGYDEDINAGQLDWLKTAKVAVLQRHQKLGQNYRSWLINAPIRYFFLTTAEELEQELAKVKMMRWAGDTSRISHICPRATAALRTFEKGQTQTELDKKVGNCPYVDDTKAPRLGSGRIMNAPSILDQFVLSFGDSEILLDDMGRFKDVKNMPGYSYQERVFGDFTCKGCLDGVPGGGDTNHEKCNATFGHGESLYSIAPKYGSDWMLLWSLNGGASPDDPGKIGEPYRFAHEYIMQEGDTLDSVARMMGTTPEAIMHLNRNRITHFINPRALDPGDIICVMPRIVDVRDRFGKYICPEDIKHVGDRYTVQTPAKTSEGSKTSM